MIIRNKETHAPKKLSRFYIYRNFALFGNKEELNLPQFIFLIERFRKLNLYDQMHNWFTSWAIRLVDSWAKES